MPPVGDDATTDTERAAVDDDGRHLPADLPALPPMGPVRATEIPW